MYWSPTDMFKIMEEINLNNDISEVIPECTISELMMAFKKHYNTFKERYDNKSNTWLLDLAFLRSMEIATALVNRDVDFDWGEGWLVKLKKIEAEFPLRKNYRLSHEGHTA